MSKQIVVGISDLNVAMNGDILVTYALGSCVGICLYDPVMKIAGLAHIMLPSIKDFKNANAQKGKFADSAVEMLLGEMVAVGALKMRIRAKIAGGAQMFATVNNSSLAGIGERNVEAVKNELSRLRIPIAAQDTGKNYGRTLFLYSEDGRMRIRSVNKGEWVF